MFADESNIQIVHDDDMSACKDIVDLIAERNNKLNNHELGGETNIMDREEQLIQIRNYVNEMTCLEAS